MWLWTLYLHSSPNTCFRYNLNSTGVSSSKSAGVAKCYVGCLQAEVERLRAVNAAAQEKVQREEWRRTAESAKSAGNAAFQAQQYEEALQQYSRGLETLASCSRIGSSAGCSSSESIDAALAAVLHCNRAAVHQACGRYLHALADCFRAEALMPSYSRIYHRRADAYWAIGAWDAAAQVGVQTWKVCS